MEENNIGSDQIIFIQAISDHYQKKLQFRKAYSYLDQAQQLHYQPIEKVKQLIIDFEDRLQVILNQVKWEVSCLNKQGVITLQKPEKRDMYQQAKKYQIANKPIYSHNNQTLSVTIGGIPIFVDEQYRPFLSRANSLLNQIEKLKNSHPNLFLKFERDNVNGTSDGQQKQFSIANFLDNNTAVPGGRQFVAHSVSWVSREARKYKSIQIQRSNSNHETETVYVNQSCKDPNGRVNRDCETQNFGFSNTQMVPSPQKQDLVYKQKFISQYKQTQRESLGYGDRFQKSSPKFNSIFSRSDNGKSNNSFIINSNHVSPFQISTFKNNLLEHDQDRSCFKDSEKLKRNEEKQHFFVLNSNNLKQVFQTPIQAQSLNYKFTNCMGPKQSQILTLSSNRHNLLQKTPTKDDTQIQRQTQDQFTSYIVNSDQPLYSGKLNRESESPSSGGLSRTNHRNFQNRSNIGPDNLMKNRRRFSNSCLRKNNLQQSCLSFNEGNDWEDYQKKQKNSFNLNRAILFSDESSDQSDDCDEQNLDSMIEYLKQNQDQIKKKNYFFPISQLNNRMNMKNIQINPQFKRDMSIEKLRNAQPALHEDNKIQIESGRQQQKYQIQDLEHFLQCIQENEFQKETINFEDLANFNNSFSNFQPIQNLPNLPSNLSQLSFLSDNDLAGFFGQQSQNNQSVIQANYYNTNSFEDAEQLIPGEQQDLFPFFEGKSNSNDDKENQNFQCYSDIFNTDSNQENFNVPKSCLVKHNYNTNRLPLQELVIDKFDHVYPQNQCLEYEIFVSEVPIAIQIEAYETQNQNNNFINNNQEGCNMNLLHTDTKNSGDQMEQGSAESRTQMIMEQSSQNPSNWKNRPSFLSIITQVSGDDHSGLKFFNKKDD